MSDWYSVIVVWSGIDNKVGKEHGTRLRSIKAKSDRKHNVVHIETVSYPCGHDAGDTMCCEFVAVGSSNYFHPETWLRAAAEYEWEYPEEVGVLWKSEEAETYNARYLPETIKT